MESEPLTFGYTKHPTLMGLILIAVTWKQVPLVDENTLINGYGHPIDCSSMVVNVLGTIDKLKHTLTRTVTSLNIPLILMRRF